MTIRNLSNYSKRLQAVIFFDYYIRIAAPISHSKEAGRLCIEYRVYNFGV